MKITDTTPPPVKRSFTIELSEDEYKMITYIVGSVNTFDIEKDIKNNNYGVKVLGGVNYVDPYVIYDTLKDGLKVK
jgi:hypothetical protein